MLAVDPNTPGDDPRQIKAKSCPPSSVPPLQCSRTPAPSTPAPLPSPPRCLDAGSLVVSQTPLLATTGEGTRCTTLFPDAASPFLLRPSR
ncbi:hypothetical protein DAI22_02g029901 [Oryza sativa Japonica Group]|nr:hypothetical protein DAI22_02g029901 [Oryza sativa Japonica Group]KAF2942947.1 hypothetical protein DAI22_02g029901 [Oryza sativa Japonica Group]